MDKLSIIIPSRYDSKRFPGKPLSIINNKMLIYRVWRIACSCKYNVNIYIATDNEIIYKTCKEFGANVLMTGPARNGTERVYQAIDLLPQNDKPEIIINLQGDAILTPPTILDSLFDEMCNDKSIGIATPAVRMSYIQYEKMKEAKLLNQASGTTVTFDKNNFALYFSKNIIPFIRVKPSECPVFQHIGLYAYRFETLKKLVSLDEGNLEKIEGLEQLRALENRIAIKVVEVDYNNRSNWSIDSPEDIKIVEKIINEEGELIDEL